MKRTVLLSIVDQAVISAFNLLLNLAFIAHAAPDAFGRFVFIVSAAFFASSAQNALVVLPLNYLLPGRAQEEADQRLSMLTSANLALTALVLAVALALGAVIEADAALSTAIVCFFATVMMREYARNILVVKDEMRRTLVHDLLAVLFSAALAVALWRALPPETAVLAALAGGNLIAFLICRFDLKFDLRRAPAHLAAYGEIWRDTRWALQGALQNEVFARGYVFLVERMRDAAALGTLNAGRVVVAPLLLVSGAWFRVARPRMVRQLSQHDAAGVRGVLASGVAVVSCAALLYGAALIAGWTLIEQYAFRHRYGDMASIVACWWLYAVLVGLTSVISGLMEARRQFRALAAVGFCSALLALALIGAALAMGCAVRTVVLALAAVALVECVALGLVAGTRGLVLAKSEAGAPS